MISFCARQGAQLTAALEERDKEERDKDKNGVPPKEKEEADAEIPNAPAKPKSKREKKHAPLHEHAYGLAYDLLHHGNIRTMLPRWQRHQEGRAKIAHAFCVAQTASERTELMELFSRTQSAALKKFVSMSRGKRLQCIRAFLSDSKVATLTPAKLTELAKWPAAVGSVEEEQQDVQPMDISDDDDDDDDDRTKARVQLKHDSLSKDPQPMDIGDDDELCNENDELGQYELDEDELDDDELDDCELDDDELDDDELDDDELEDAEEQEQGKSQKQRQKKLKRPRVVAPFPGSQARFTAQMLPMDGHAMTALLALARNQRTKVRKQKTSAN